MPENIKAKIQFIFYRYHINHIMKTAWKTRVHATQEETVSVSAQQLQPMLRHAMRPAPVLHGELQKSVVSCSILLALNRFFHKRKMSFHVFILNTHYESQHNTPLCFFLSAVFCEYYNNEPEECVWHYHECHTPCYKTCLYPEGTCINPIPNLEGKRSKRKFDGHTQVQMQCK